MNFLHFLKFQMRINIHKPFNNHSNCFWILYFVIKNDLFDLFFHLSIKLELTGAISLLSVLNKRNHNFMPFVLLFIEYFYSFAQLHLIVRFLRFQVLFNFRVLLRVIDILRNILLYILLSFLKIFIHILLDILIRPLILEKVVFFLV